MINNWLEVLADILQHSIWLAPIIVLLAGLLTSLTPCSLSSIPLIIGYMGYITDTDEGNTRKMFKVSLVYALGQSVSLTILATLAALMGKLMKGTNQYWFIFLGVLMVLMSLQVMDIIHIIKPLHLRNRNKKKGYFGAFLVGTVGGIFSSSCATPILVVLLGLIARSDNVLFGVILMFIYSLGANSLVIIAGTFTGSVQRILENERYKIFSDIMKYIMGIGILLIGFYMFYIGF